jgi:hypothetical protein
MSSTCPIDANFGLQTNPASHGIGMDDYSYKVIRGKGKNQVVWKYCPVKVEKGLQFLLVTPVT